MPGRDSQSSPERKSVHDVVKLAIYLIDQAKRLVLDDAIKTEIATIKRILAEVLDGKCSAQRRTQLFEFLRQLGLKGKIRRGRPKTDDDIIIRAKDFLNAKKSKTPTPPKHTHVGFLSIEDAVSALYRKAFSKFSVPDSLQAARSATAYKANIRSMERVDFIRHELRQALLKEELDLYWFPDRPSDQSEIRVPADMLRFIIPVHNGIPNKPVHFKKLHSHEQGPVLVPPLELSAEWRSKFKTGSLFVHRADFENWCKHQPKMLFDPVHPRPRKTGGKGRPPEFDWLEKNIRQLVAQGAWTARQSIANLRKLLSPPASARQPDEKTVRLAVDGLAKKDDNPAFKRTKRRSSGINNLEQVSKSEI